MQIRGYKLLTQHLTINHYALFPPFGVMTTKIYFFNWCHTVQFRFSNLQQARVEFIRKQLGKIVEFGKNGVEI